MTTDAEGHVVKLTVYDNNLTGQLPPAVSRLEFSAGDEIRSQAYLAFGFRATGLRCARLIEQCDCASHAARLDRPIDSVADSFVVVNHQRCCRESTPPGYELRFLLPCFLQFFPGDRTRSDGGDFKTFRVNRQHRKRDSPGNTWRPRLGGGTTEQEKGRYQNGDAEAKTLFSSTSAHISGAGADR